MPTSSSNSLRIALIAAFLVGGAINAVPVQAKKRVAIDYAPILSTPSVAPVPNGAIFQVANGYAPLTSGSRASMVGDVLTITLVEKTQASKSSTAATDRSGSVGLTPPTTGPASFFQPTDATASGTNKFDGKGAATQSNQLDGEISVTIAQVYANGTMLVRGQKLLTLNRGDENIQITGIVRAADISPDNRVLSTRVADARITYAGKGDIARASKPGWLNHFFSILSPF